MCDFEVRKSSVGPEVWFALIPDGADSVTFYVAQVVAEAMGGQDDEVPPLNNYVSADALNRFWNSGCDFSIEFEYGDYLVELNSTGRLRVRVV